MWKDMGAWKEISINNICILGFLLLDSTDFQSPVFRWQTINMGNGLFKLLNKLYILLSNLIILNRLLDYVYIFKVYNIPL
jgi:hypothetical protein